MKTDLDSRRDKPLSTAVRDFYIRLAEAGSCITTTASFLGPVTSSLPNLWAFVDRNADSLGHQPMPKATREKNKP